jgi:hypothetical protein
MKLYSKINSDRAGKCQGGNDYINIELYSGSALHSKLDYTINYTDTGLAVRDDSGRVVYTTKGKRLKRS